MLFIAPELIADAEEDCLLPAVPTKPGGGNCVSSVKNSNTGNNARGGLPASIPFVVIKAEPMSEPSSPDSSCPPSPSPPPRNLKPLIFADSRPVANKVCRLHNVLCWYLCVANVTFTLEGSLLYLFHNFNVIVDVVADNEQQKCWQATNWWCWSEEETSDDLS